MTNNTVPVPVTLVSVLRRCYWGEFPLQGTSASSVDVTCTTCGANQFSRNRQECAMCPSNADCAPLQSDERATG